MIFHGRMTGDIMVSSARIACALAIVAALCVLSVFFFPGIEGPYSAVNGPVTALLSIRAASMLRLGIANAALTILWSIVAFVSLLLAAFWCEWGRRNSFYSCTSPTCYSTLRC